METIKFSDWKKLDIRVAKIKEVKDHPKADKLYILKVDTGVKEIDIVAGIKSDYAKDDLVGKKIIVFTNLEHAKLRGVESEGMLLAATNDDKVVLLMPEKDIEVGSRIE